MQPRRGNSSAAPAVGPLIREHMAQLRLTDGTTSLVAERALSREAHRPKLAQTPRPSITRGPVPFSDARAAFVQAEPQPRRPRVAGDRDQEGASTSGGGAPRWVLIPAEPRQAPRPVANPLRPPSDQEVNAFQTRCGAAVACAAAAPQALATFAPGFQATGRAISRVCPTSRDGTRGHPGPGRQPASVVYPLTGALAARLARRPARVDPPRGVILATQALDATLLPPPALVQGAKGQRQAERGGRFRQDPPCVASSVYLTKPARIMARLLGMTGCWLV